MLLRLLSGARAFPSLSTTTTTTAQPLRLFAVSRSSSAALAAFPTAPVHPGGSPRASSSSSPTQQTLCMPPAASSSSLLNRIDLSSTARTTSSYPSARDSYAPRAARSPSPPRSRRDLEPSAPSYSAAYHQSSSYGPSTSSYPSSTRKRSPDTRRSPSPQPYKRHQPATQSSYGPPSSSYSQAPFYQAPPPPQQQQPPYYQQTRGYATQISSMAPSRRHGGRSAPRSGASAVSAASLPSLPGPVLTAAEIESQFSAQLKPQWRAEPKGPLSNYHLMTGQGQTGLGTNGDKFTFEECNVDGRRVYRCSVTADPGMNIVGTGDDANKREAEKLACLSAILQLAQRGLLEARGNRPVPYGSAPVQEQQRGMATAASSARSSRPGSAAGLNEPVISLSQGEVINYARARQFMEFYCQKFGFGTPHIEYRQTASAFSGGGKYSKKKGKGGGSEWQAEMHVAGRRIGVGAAPSKKDSLQKCYLDVAQYLEVSDPALWVDFKLKNPFAEASGNKTAHVLFSINNDLEDDIRDLSKNIRDSEIWSKSGSARLPSSPELAPAQLTIPAVDPEVLQQKSDRLKLQLETYEASSKPNVAALRKQRSELPVTTKAADVLAKIQLNWTTIVMAATGSGKTTQIPQLILDDYIRRAEGASCNIVCTQPRRIAAMSVAQRVAAERDQPIGQNVGYQVRFDSKLPAPHGSITFCTTGIFLKRLQSALSEKGGQSERWLDEISHIIVDEAHERDIDVDLLLVVLQQLIRDRKAKQRPLKVILMSATIDPTLFQKYFADETTGRLAPVAEVPGRSFPVEKHFLDSLVPRLRESTPNHRGGWVFGDKDVMKYLDQELYLQRGGQLPETDSLKTPHALIGLLISDIIQNSEDGHVLVFLDGIQGIRDVQGVLEDGRQSLGVDFNTPRTPIHILHSSIPVADQQAVFEPKVPGQRRIILATNIAETSITIPDVVYVVDSVRVKEKRYDSSKHLSSLVSAWVGQSNLNQRAGRAGRHREGVYYGVISRARLAALAPYALVEMKRSDLSNVIMHIKALNFAGMDVKDVLGSCIEPPSRQAVENAIQRLRQIGAFDDNEKLTSLGRVLQELPVDVQIAKLVLYGAFYRCLDSALTLAAIIGDQEPFVSPMDKKARADEVKDSWSPPGFRSDLLAAVSAYNFWYTLQSQRRWAEANNFLSENFIKKANFVNVQKVKEQIWFSLLDTGVIDICAGGLKVPKGAHQSHLRAYANMPLELNTNSDSLPLLAALIATSSAPNFAIRMDQKAYRTSQDKKCSIHPSSVNMFRRENLAAESSTIIGEKALMAFVEKVAVGSNGDQPAQLRNTTRLDPMTYLLFGAYHLRSTSNGLLCDDWLPMVGNMGALDEVQRLKNLLDGCMLRIFQGVGAALAKQRNERLTNRNTRRAAYSRENLRTIRTIVQGNDDNSDDDDEVEHEAGVELEETPVDLTLSSTEVIELDNLASDVVAILDRYAEDRGATASRAPTRPGSPQHHPMTAPIQKTQNPNAYVPPAARMGAGAGLGGYSGRRAF